jgi:tetratricopeptide (TPR) repeat protein
MPSNSSPIPSCQRRGLLQAGAALLLAPAAGPLLAQSRPDPARALPPLVRVPDASIPIELARLQLDCRVAGRHALSRIELEVYNPNPQALEGELNFPLQEGQTVTGLSLDIEGELRPAVPVEKARGRQVFEDVTRLRVDPALLESAAGNVYKLRLYPLPGRGSRRVVLEVAQLLPLEPSGGAESALLRIPVQPGMPVRQLDLQVRVAAPQRSPGPLAASFGSESLRPQRDGADAVLRVQRTRYAAASTLRVSVPVPRDEAQIVAHTYRDATYFHAEVPVAVQERQRQVPRRLALLWDASGSAGQRDLSRELGFLDALFRAFGNLEVDLLVVRDEAEPVRRFAIAQGDWSELRENLRTLPRDGATRLDRLVAGEGADLALLFSDGQGTWGEGGMARSGVPLYAVVSSAGVDAARLRQAAEQSGGALVDLARGTAADAVAQVRRERTRLLEAWGPGVDAVVVESRVPQGGRLALAGRLRDPHARLTLRLQEPGGAIVQRTVQVPAPTPAAAGDSVPLAALRWASLRLAELEPDAALHEQEIRRIGLQFRLVTSGTSLIVLDRVEDYVRHSIEPPASLLPAYERLVAQRGERERTQRQNHLDRVAQRFAEKQRWWEREFPKDTPPAPPPPAKAAAGQRSEASESRTAPARPGMPPPMAPPPPPPAPAPAPPYPAAPPSTSSRLMTSPAPAAAAAASPAAGSAGADAVIALRRWIPDSPAGRRLRDAAPDRLYAVYLDERAAQANSPAFFLDAADVFFERGQPALARRVLSNLAELALENRHVLRLLAYRLLQASEVDLALPLLRKVLALSPDEPQSFRDLGLALARQGRTQDAANRLWDVVSRPWNDRFPDIELIALAELNAVVAAARGGTVDTSAFDARLMRNLPLDLRVVLAWDADNTDVDLHVVDPDGQVAYYGRQLTYQGGRMSRDFTGGYGPEEFALRKAKPGTYTVKADFFGHRQQVVAPATTLMLRLTTGFGTPAQKDVDTVLRLTGEARMVTVGTFKVGD